MIALEDVSVVRKPLALAGVTLNWGQGVHSVIGTQRDGGPLLLALLGGAARPRAGRLRVLEGLPTQASIRKQVARLSLDTALPEALRVGEALAMAAAIRGEPPRSAADRLSVLALEGLETRLLRSISRAEARSVALVEALTSSQVRVLLVEEPLVGMDTRATGRIPQALRARAQAGCAVIVATASLRDAGELADDHVFLHRGSVVGVTSSLEALAGFSNEGARLRVVTRDLASARALVAAVARENDIDAVEHDGISVSIRGRDILALARAAGRAATSAQIDPVELRVQAPTLDEARAAAAGTPVSRTL
jgi:ABC-2 type transport system ATP-binding protein